LRPYAEYALALAHANGLKPVVTSVTRTFTEQQGLRSNFERCVARGAFPSPPNCRWPANRPGDSAHNYGLAWDSWVPAPQVPLWRAIREWVGWEVPSNDIIHAQVPQWRRFVTPPPRPNTFP